MEAAAEVTAPKKRKTKAKVEEAKPLTWKERMAAVDARAAETRQAVEAEYAARGYGPAHRTSTRWMGRTKGLAFSRHILKATNFVDPQKPAVLTLFHPTKGDTKRLSATPELLRTFFPSLPAEMSAQMLGIAHH